MFQRILVPLDGSARAECAIPMAARIARAFGSTIILITVVAPPVSSGKFRAQAVYPEVGTDEELAEAAEYLKKVSASDQLHGLPVERHALVGAVAPTLLDEIATLHIDLVVLWSHGFTGLTQWILGSIAHKLVRTSPVPLLLLREERQEPAATEQQPVRALVALDGSCASETVLEPIVALTAGLARATDRQGELQLLQVVDVPASYGRFRHQVDAFYDAEVQTEVKRENERYLKTVAERLEQGNSSLGVSTIATTDSDVAHAIVQTAGQNQVDLIAMATHGRGGVQRWALGSITERVLHATRTPLFIVRPPHK